MSSAYQSRRALILICVGESVGLVGAVWAFCRLFAYSVVMGDYVKGVAGVESLPTNGELLWTIAGLMAAFCLVGIVSFALIIRSE